MRMQLNTADKNIKNIFKIEPEHYKRLVLKTLEILHKQLKKKADEKKID